MKPEDLSPNASGSLERNPQGNWTFVPNPLPPDLPWNDALAAELARADFALGELAGLGRNLPNPHLLIRRRGVEIPGGIQWQFNPGAAINPAASSMLEQGVQ